jgi:hypothetical protein
VRLTVPVLRDLVMLALGSAGMVRELFFNPQPELDMRRVGLSIGLLLGPAALHSLWRARQPPPEATPTGSPPLSSRSPSRRQRS